MNIAILSCGLMAALLVTLSLLVSLVRVRTGQGFGMEPDAGAWLNKVVRAQGNAAEYIPLFIVLIVILEIEGNPNWADWVFIAAVASRYCHAAGMLLSSNLNKVHPLRLLGTLGSYTCGFILSGLVILGAL